MNKKVVALFDLDGVIVDTESQYSVFWSTIGKKYVPGIPDFGSRIKGNTLTQIYAKYFADKEELQSEITREIDAWERDMTYDFVPGVQEFLSDLRTNGVKTAIVTSSNDVKMTNIYKIHPGLKAVFDTIVTADLITRSKPDPECYLMAAGLLNAVPENCYVFEDSMAGLKAGRAAEMTVVGLSTTLSEDQVRQLSDKVIPDFHDFSYADMIAIRRKE